MSGKTPVEPMDSSQQNSPVAGPVSDEATVMLDSAKNVCFWNGAQFSEGDTVVSAGTEYECTYGQWVKQG